MMKKLYGIIFSLLLILGFAGIATAQPADIPTPERQAERMTKVMAERLDLSEQQKEKVRSLNLELARKQKELLQNEELDYFEQLDELKGITVTREKKLKTILDNQQYEKYYALNHRTRIDSTLTQ